MPNTTPAVLTTVSDLCWNVNHGTKPAGMLAIQDRYLHAAELIIEHDHLWLKCSNLADGWVELWVYKNKTVRKIIDGLPAEPKTACDHALLGYLFGYNTESICEYIEGKNNDSFPNKTRVNCRYNNVK